MLDDDPTGTQTVHGVPVLTEWSRESLAAELRAPGPGFFILTNSRAFPVEEACAINREIAGRLREEALAVGIAAAASPGGNVKAMDARRSAWPCVIATAATAPAFASVCGASLCVFGGVSIQNQPIVNRL